MSHFLRVRANQQTPPAIVLGLCCLLIYQLGNCACGCPQHNQWILAAGVFTAFDHHGRSDDETSPSTDHNHDHECPGGDSDQYLPAAGDTLLGQHHAGWPDAMARELPATMHSEISVTRLIGCAATTCDSASRCAPLRV